jgi:hypothetical protein
MDEASGSGRSVAGHDAVPGDERAVVVEDDVPCRGLAVGL